MANNDFGVPITGGYYKNWGEIQGFIFRTQEEVEEFKRIAESAEVGGRIVAEKLPASFKEKNSKSPDYQFKYETPAIVNRREAGKKAWLAKNGKPQAPASNDVI